MATDASIGHGAKFLIGTGAGPTYNELAEVTEISPPEVTRDAVEATHFGSPDRTREHIPGLKDAGEVTVSYNLIPGGPTDDAIRAQLDDDDTHPLRIAFPDGSTLSFNGFCTGMSQVIPIDDKMTGSATFKVSGLPVYAGAA